MAGPTRRVGVFLIAALLLFGVFGSTGSERVHEWIDDSVSSAQKGKIDGLVSSVLELYQQSRFLSEDFVILATARGEHESVRFEESGICLSYCALDRFLNVHSGLGIEKPLALTCITGTSEGEKLTLGERLERALDNAGILRDQTAGEIGLIVVRESLLPEMAGDGAAIGALFPPYFSPSENASSDQLKSLSERGVLAFVAHDWNGFVNGSGAWEGLLPAVRSGLGVVSGKPLFFFVCGPSGSTTDIPKNAIDELIHKHGAAGVIYFDGPISIQAVRAVLGKLAAQPHDRPILESLLDSMWQALTIEGLTEESRNSIQEMMFRLVERFALRHSAYC